MINRTELDQVLMDHAMRVARFNREGWKWEASRSAGGGRLRQMPAAVGLVRRHLGGALVGAGERLRGTPAGLAANPTAATRYTLDAVR